MSCQGLRGDIFPHFLSSTPIRYHNPHQCAEFETGSFFLLVNACVTQRLAEI
jgi:hypothetical protein